MMNRYATMGLAFAAAATAISVTAPAAHAQFQGNTLRASVRGDGQLDNGDRNARLSMVSVDLRSNNEATLRFTPQGNYRTNDINFEYRGRWRRDGEDAIRLSLTDGASGDGVIYLTRDDRVDRLDLSGRANGDGFRIRFASLQNGGRGGGGVRNIPRPGGNGDYNGSRDQIPTVLRPRDGYNRDDNYNRDDRYNRNDDDYNGRRNSQWDERRDGDDLRSLSANRNGSGTFTAGGGRDERLDRYEAQLRPNGVAEITLYGPNGFERRLTGRWSGGKRKSGLLRRDRRDPVDLTLDGGGSNRNGIENGRGKLYFRTDGDGFDRIELEGQDRNSRGNYGRGNGRGNGRNGRSDGSDFRVNFRPDR